MNNFNEQNDILNIENNNQKQVQELVQAQPEALQEQYIAQELPQEQLTRKERFKNIIRTALIVILGAFLGLLVRMYLLEIVQVNGLSMYPTLNHNDKLMLNKMSHSYDRRDIVVLIGKETTHRENDIIKRIIGVAGDKIEFKENKLYLNDELLEEDYIPQGEHYYEDKVVLVPEDSVYVLGDNRDNSQDSRFFGPVDIKNIKGKIFK